MDTISFTQLATELADCAGSVAALRLVERLYPKLQRHNDRGILEQSCSIDRLIEEVTAVRRQRGNA